MAVVTIDTIRTESLLEHAQSLALDLTARLHPLVGRHGVSAVRVAGAQVAVVFCDGNGQPDPAGAELVQRRLREQQMLVYGGGRHGECGMLLPPINLPRAVLRDALSRLLAQIERTRLAEPLGWTADCAIDQPT